ncbi:MULTISPECIES: hypothetical protein [Microbacterium]|uniref:Glycoside hydrolase family 2 immunoglobulin-like beta-sandwich domain-containing protein n=1 Tax=Microbacterium wangchenii TaxID=2541726 RepID=A0ABX5SUY9_9MICO|nr:MULTISPECIES: hypothetical protein [Microbacterium]QBR90008.1 hypothetical protein E4K62_15715 [Microbacterium wangchenii]TXK09272.1 hypothetical protein FVP99_18085 [Microbacterium wangchenii]
MSATPTRHRFAHEVVDFDAPAAITTRAELDAEVERLRSDVPAAVIENERPLRTVHALTQWNVRACAERPADPAAADASEFAPVTLPHSTEDAYLHFRAVTVPSDAAWAERAVLRVVRPDYEAVVYVDGRAAGRRRGYLGTLEVEIDARRARQIDIVIRRARDRYRWSGESEGENFGDAHGKGLGSVVADAVTAGAALDAVELELRPPVHLAYVAADARADGTADVAVEVGGADEATEGLSLVVTVSTADGDVVARQRHVVAGTRTSVPLSAAGITPWSPVAPVLYRLTVQVWSGDELVDEIRRPMGFRTFERAADGSLSLNGAPVLLRGTTTIGCVWDASREGRDEDVIRQLLIVKALFGNVLRVHVAVPPARVFELADRVGVMIYQDGPFQWHCFASREAELDDELLQVEELARTVAGHPSVVVVSVPNEMHMKVPFHDADVAFVERAAEVLREQAPGAVHLQDWSGGTRPRALPQAVHDYPGYFYATTGALTGVFDDPANEQVDPGVRAIVSEYGGGVVPSWEAMRRTQDAHARRGETITLPPTEDGRWTAEASLYEMTGEMVRTHQRVIGWRDSFAEYHRVSGEAQSRVLTRQTGRMRRDRRHVSGVIHHYLQNPGDVMYNPWVDLHVIDNAGELTGGFSALRDALRPVSLEVTGLPNRAYGGSSLNPEIWVCNDLPAEIAVDLEWTARTEAGEVVAAETVAARLGAGSAVAVATPEIVLPAVDEAGAIVLTARLRIEGRAWVEAAESVQVHPAAPVWEGDVDVLGDLDGFVERAGAWMPRLRPYAADNAHPVVVTPDVALTAEVIHELRSATEHGRIVVLLERRPGDDLGWIGKHIELAVTGDQPVEVANVELSMRDSGLTTDDLSRWATPDGRVLTNPLMGIDRRGTPAWARCGHGLQMSAIQEASRLGGLVLVCQLLVWSTLSDEPMAARVLQALLAAPYRPI